MMPTTRINGFGASSPRLWPMGIGAGQPCAMESTEDRWRYEYRWDDSGRLAELIGFTGGDEATRREVYTWRGGELERIREFDADFGDVFGDEWTRELAWEWEHGRPIAMRLVWPDAQPDQPREVWRWADDGRTLWITESSSAGPITQQTIALDAAGRMVRREMAWTIDSSRTELDATWSDDGRLLSARERSGPGLVHEHVIELRWDDRGRLIAQRSSNYPGVDQWLYRYPDEP